jgi:hypothetical protein
MLKPSELRAADRERAKKAATNRVSLIDLRSAVAHKAVDFAALDLVRSRARTDREFEQFYPTILEAFQKLNGPMVQAFFFDQGATCVTLSPRRWHAHWLGFRRKPTIHDVLEISDAPADLLALYGKCSNLARRADLTLRGASREVSIYSTVGMLSHLFASIERAHDRNVSQGELALVEEMLVFENDVFERAAVTTLKGRFLAGMVSALPLVVAVAGLAAVMLSRAHLHPYKTSHFVVSVCMGSIGAVVAAMRRMSSGRITAETSRSAAFASGMSRPFVGAIFGAVIYFALASGLLGIQLSGSESRQFFAIATLGFVAGLSERVARGMLATFPGASSLADGTGASTEPSPALRPPLKDAPAHVGSVEPADVSPVGHTQAVKRIVCLGSAAAVLAGAVYLLSKKRG